MSVSDKMQVECLRFDALSGSMRSELAALRDAQERYDNPFFDLDFAGHIAEFRDDTRVLVARDEAGLLGYWALHVRPNKWARAIGAPFSDWHGPVIRAGSALAPDEFLRLGGLRGMTATGLKPMQLKAQFGGVISACGIAATPDGADAYRAQMRGLHPKHFKNVRRAERLIARDFKTSEVRIDDTSLEAFEWLMSMKQKQFDATGKHNVLKPDWVQSMMGGLRTKRYPRLRGRLSTLRFDGELAAAEFDILSDKVVHGWITSYNHDFSNYSPGHILMLSVISDMENTGHSICDIGADNHAYKTYYESYQEPTEYTVIRTGVGTRPLASAWRFCEEKTPARLNNLMVRVRRRSDQVFSTELDLAGRVRGLLHALSPKK